MFSKKKEKKETSEFYASEYVTWPHEAKRCVNSNLVVVF